MNTQTIRELINLTHKEIYKIESQQNSLVGSIEINSCNNRMNNFKYLTYLNKCLDKLLELLEGEK